MAGTTHVYAGVAATVGAEHSGNLGGIFDRKPAAANGST